MATRKTKDKVKVGKLKVKTTKIDAKDLKKIKGGRAGWDVKANVKV